MSEKANNQIVADLATAALEPKNIELDQGGKVQLLAIPTGYNIQDLELYDSAPSRIKANETLHSIDSFIEYVNEFKAPNTSAIFSRPKGNLPFRCTFDYHGPGKPAWGDHIALLEVTETPEWKLWKSNEKTRFSQRKFLIFLEDNAQDIVDDLAPLLKMVKTTTVNKSGHRETTVSNDAESRSGSDNITLSSGIAPEIKLALSVWKFSDPYEIKVRLLAHIADDGVTFSYQLINADRVEDALFKDYRNQIAQDTGLPVYV